MNQERSSKQKKCVKSSTYIRAGTIRSLADKQKSLRLSNKRTIPASSNQPNDEQQPSITGNDWPLPVSHPQAEGAQTVEHFPNTSPSAVEEQVHHDSSIPAASNEQCEEQGTAAKKKQRGRTQMQSVHARAERRLIVLNELNQPVGPTKKDVTELGSFLGTLARNSTLCPLDITDWRKMDTKDDLWEYTKGKYNIPEAGKKWTFQAIQSAWRSHKIRLKREHSDKYDDDAMRIANRPEDVSESVFKKLLEYWNSEKVQKLSKSNIENRKKLKNPHTVGKKSFALFRSELEKEKESSNPLTLKDIFEKTRARKPERSYKVSDEDTTSKLAEMEKLETHQSEDGDEPVNSFTSVMGPEHPGRLRLYGRAVTQSSLKGKAGQREPSRTAANGQMLTMEEMMLEMNKKFEEEKATLRQEILADVISQLRRSGYPVDREMLDAQQPSSQPNRRPSVGSNNNAGVANHEQEMDEGEELDLI